MCSSITQFVRISPKLLNKNFNFKENYKKILFHEIFLCSSCNTNKDEDIFLSTFNKKNIIVKFIVINMIL